MSGEEEPVAWLREQIKGDGKSAAARLRRKMSDDYRRVQMEKLARAKAELAILDEHEAENGCGLALELYGKPGDEVIRICKTCGTPPPCRTVRLLAGGYRHRPGFPASLLAKADES